MAESPKTPRGETIDARIKDWASEREREIIDAVLEHGSSRAAAKTLGINASSVCRAIQRAERKAARAGYSPSHDYTATVPPGFHVRGVSQLRKNGEVLLEWVKSQKDREYEWELLRDAVSDYAEEYSGLVPSVPEPTEQAESDLLAVLPMGDPHVGLLAWHEETGEDFDLKRAELTLTEATRKLVDLAPTCEQALVINLGDFFHSDNYDNRTRRGGHALDVDSRWPKVLRVGFAAMVRCVEFALAKHRRVRVINAIGNHDDQSAVMLSLFLDAWFRANDRVEIDVSPAAFHWYRFGANLIGVTHGDKIKPDKLPGVMAADQAESWGETRHRYWYTGHVHHDAAREYPGCVVESFRTLAARDAWHTQQGYRSGRDMKCDVIHREHGRVLRHTVGVGMLRSAA